MIDIGSPYVYRVGMKALDKAISLAGGPSALARALGVGKSVISNWRARGVPVEFCPRIERAVGRQVLCEELNDTVDWGFIRSAPVLQMQESE